MVIEILFVCLLAKWKRYQLRYLCRTWTFYPILIVQCFLVVFQASVFFDSYIFLRFVPYVEFAVILSFVCAILVYRLYTPAILGSGMVVLGTLLNKFVIAANGGKMPIFPSLSYLTGYVDPAAVGTLDSLHILGGTETKFAFLTDYIDYGYCILSPGDLLIHLFACVMLYQLIKAVNAQFGKVPTADKKEK